MPCILVTHTMLSGSASKLVYTAIVVGVWFADCLTPALFQVRAACQLLLCHRKACSDEC
jgi:hypothetical protein